MSDFPRYKIIQKPFVEPSTKLFMLGVVIVAVLIVGDVKVLFVRV